MAALPWTRPQVIQALQDWQKIHGYGPTTMAWSPSQATRLNRPDLAQNFHDANGKWPNARVIYTLFDSWDHALKEAGVKKAPRERRRNGDDKNPNRVKRLVCNDCGEHMREPSPTGQCGFCCEEQALAA